jgi:hypothetical protein
MASYPPFTNYISSHQQLPLGHIIGSVDVVDCIHTADLQNILSSEERAFGDFTLGRWGWMLSNAAQLEQPIKASGSLGLWSFDMLEEFEPDYIGPDEKEVSNG